MARSTNDVVSLVESKELARNAIPPTTASIYFKKKQLLTTEKQPNRIQSGICPSCTKKIALFSEGARGWNTCAHRQCIECNRTQRSKHKAQVTNQAEQLENNSASEVGAVFSQISSVSTPSHNEQTSVNVVDVKTGHRIFTKGAWRRARFMNHPEAKLTVSVRASDYCSFVRRYPQVSPTTITAMTDSGAQSCLWSMDGFLKSWIHT